MSIIKKYIVNYLLKENIQDNKNISSLFLKSILVKDSEGYLLEEAYIEDDHELDDLIRTGNCEDEFFKQVYESILSNGFKYFARGTGRIVFTHPQAPNLIFKLVIPGEETDENIKETAKEKAMMKKHSHLFGNLYTVSGNIPRLFNNTEDYFIIVEKLIPLFNTDFECVLGDKTISALKSQFGFSGSLINFKKHMRDKLIKYYELALGQESEDYAHIEVPASPPDMLDIFCQEVIKFSKEVKPDNVGLKAAGSNKYKFVMLDV
jgi:hypothetical protein